MLQLLFMEHPNRTGAAIINDRYSDIMGVVCYLVVRQD